jgi:hypothetical protein
MAPVTLLAAVLLNGLKRDSQCIAYWVVHGARPTSTDARVSTPGMTLQLPVPVTLTGSCITDALDSSATAIGARRG